MIKILKHMKKIIISIIIFISIGSTLFSCKQAFAEKHKSSDYSIHALKHPVKVTFAGEKAPLSRWYVKEAFDRELLVNTYWQSQTLLLLKRAAKYFPIIDAILKEENMPEDIKYIAVIESGLIPTAVSPSKARGMWQFLKNTGKEYGLEINDEVDERYHITKATRAACRYLRDAHELLGSWTLAAAAYNAGKSGVSEQIEKQGVKNYYNLLLNPETGRYVYRILALKTILESPRTYGFYVEEEDLYVFPQVKKVLINKPIKDWAIWAKEHGINYMLLKKLNPWLRKNYLTNKSAKSYEILLPTK